LAANVISYIDDIRNSFREGHVSGTHNVRQKPVKVTAAARFG